MGRQVSGKLDLTPWARQAIPEADRAALRARVPDGNTLTVSTHDHRVFVVSLASRAGRLSEYRGTDLAHGFDVVVPVSYMRCSTCGKRLGDYGECDSCTFDRQADDAAR